VTTDDTHDWKLACAGEGEAFGRIFDRHRDRVFRHGLRLVDRPADVDDLVAITFLEAWRRRDSVRIVEGSVLPWLLVTATNASLNLRRGSRRYRTLLARLPVDPHTADHAERFDDGEAAAALRALAPIDRQVLTLCVLEGYSERDAASALGVPTGTIKSRLARARTRLARSYEGAPREV